MHWYNWPYYAVIDIYLILRNHVLAFLTPHPPQSWSVGDKGDVILLQGHNAEWVSLKKIGKAIHKKGYRIHFVEKIGSDMKSVPEATKDVEEYIHKNKLENIIVIGHSKGGIIAISLLKNKEIAPRITRIINIAGPIKGMLASSLIPSVSDLVPTSEVISHLEDGINKKKIVNLYPRVDDFVLPNSSLTDDGMINKQIPVIGHVRIVEDKRTIREIESYL